MVLFSLFSLQSQQPRAKVQVSRGRRTKSGTGHKKNDEAWSRFADLARAALVGTATLLPSRAEANRGRANAAACLLSIKIGTTALKRLLPERRPNGDDNKSFPSEHAAECTAAAILMTREYTGQLAAAACGLAAVAAFARVAGQKHHPRDVVAGAIPGVGRSMDLT